MNPSVRAGTLSVGKRSPCCGRGVTRAPGSSSFSRGQQSATGVRLAGRACDSPWLSEPASLGDSGQVSP